MLLGDIQVEVAPLYPSFTPKLRLRGKVQALWTSHTSIHRHAITLSVKSSRVELGQVTKGKWMFVVKLFFPDVVAL